MSEYIEHDTGSISVGIVSPQQFIFAEPPNEMVLESGRRLGPVTLAYETYGHMNADKSNVILADGRLFKQPGIIGVDS